MPPRSECRAPFVVPKGSAAIWQVRVKNFDLGFGVRLRRQGLGGAVEDNIVTMRRYKVRNTVVVHRLLNEFKIYRIANTPSGGGVSCGGEVCCRPHTPSRLCV